MREAENRSDFPILSLVLPFEYSSAGSQWDQQTNKKKNHRRHDDSGKPGMGNSYSSFPEMSHTVEYSYKNLLDSTLVVLS